MIVMMLFLFFLISIFNGVDDIEWEIVPFTNATEMSYDYCLAKELLWGCSDGRNREINILVDAFSKEVRCPNYELCTVLQHEIKHAELFESCAKFIELLPTLTTEYCSGFSNWHWSADQR